MILDTNYLIDLFSGKSRAHEKAEDLQRNQEIQRVPVPVLSELEYGAEWVLDEHERRRIRNLSRMYSITRLDEEMAIRAGQLLARADGSAGSETGPDMIDALVASVAETVDERVVTDNVTDFERLGVSVESF
ncbi:PIN domain-containing protein [Halapricum desulfuricans]|uniref:Ribonuclease VapC n=1 Tax=Halapricum desulfuricans TaxID=2841257 RepID=A0A897N4F1_9EURY|nr:PIN domain-containing protein [Halapricum desulfuricans]QSG09270.1 PIN domain containing protein [Halapricum desulfuricans]